MKYNCCQQSGLCPKNKTCKPTNFLQKPWKRFTCEHSHNSNSDKKDQPITITSCQGYANISRASGVYRVVGSDKSVYKVYCYFDSNRAWTLVQSYSYANGTTVDGKFSTPLFMDNPVSENVLTWSGYRLNRQRMKNIVKNSSSLLFTCDYEKTSNVENSDHIELSLSDLVDDNIIELSHYSKGARIKRLKIGGIAITGCVSYVYQYHDPFETLHVRSYLTHCHSSGNIMPECPNGGAYFALFGGYKSSLCFAHSHKCLINSESTTQIWFGS